MDRRMRLALDLTEGEWLPNEDNKKAFLSAENPLCVINPLSISV